MLLTDAQVIAVDLMYHHGLHNWTFVFDNARKRFGVCRYRRREIGLSRPLTMLNTVERVRDVILHEIAHALAGSHAKHGWQWRAKAQEIGAKPERCYTARDTNMPEAPYYLCCPNGECGRRTPVYRRPRVVRACGACCLKHNRGRFDARFRMVVEERR